MHHIRIDPAQAKMLDASDLKRTLALMAASMDARFVRAGTTLATAIDTIDRIIHSIEGVTSTLDESVAGIAVTSLKDVASQLDALPEVQATREAAMARIGTASRVLRDHVMDMRQALRVLHIYGMNIKIAASGEAAFVGFVNDMGQRLAAGEEHLEGFLAKLKELSTSVGSVQQAGRLLAAEAKKILPAVPQRLTRDADALHDHLGNVATMAREVGAIARTVQGRVATMLGALQVGDSTRQRVEHVVAALQLLDGVTLPAETTAEITGVIHHLLAAQLEASSVDFDRDASLLVASLKALQPDTHGLLNLIEDDAGSNGRPFLSQIDQAVGEIAVITVQLQEADQRSASMLGLITETVDELTGRLAHLQRVQFNVQDIATNTRLLCRRHGDLGKAVSVIGQGETRQVQRITPQDIAVLPPGTSIQKLLNRMPGVNVQSNDAFGANEESQTISLRGFNGTRLGYTLDGLPLGDNAYGNYNGLNISRALIAENFGGVELASGIGALGTASTSSDHSTMGTAQAATLTSAA